MSSNGLWVAMLPTILEGVLGTRYNTKDEGEEKDMWRVNITEKVKGVIRY